MTAKVKITPVKKGISDKKIIIFLASQKRFFQPHQSNK
jgi:hypothetical protein